MATYKVMQDIEAEDKLVGPLSLWQFIYAGGAALMFYLSFVVTAKGAPFLMAVFLPPGLFCAFFAIPWSREQSTDVWALAKIRFYLKPRKRIWNQSGVKELVTITAPKHVEKHYTNGLTQTEVQSRLNALASTIDSRGWVIKNVNVNLNTMPSPMAELQSDRLVDMSSYPQEVSNIDVTASDDMLDVANNPVAQQFDAMIAEASAAHRQRVVSQLNNPTPNPVQATGQGQPADYWFLNQPSPQVNGQAPTNATYVKPQVVYPGVSNDDSPAVVPAAEPTEEEKALIAQIKEQHQTIAPAYSHLKTIRPLGDEPPTPPPVAPPVQTQAVTAPLDPAKMDLVRNNDLNISTIARLANEKEPPSDEVVISLH